jgi:hypothetical protein
MPFDATPIDTALSRHLDAALTISAFLGRLIRLVPVTRLEIDGPGEEGGYWIDLSLGDLAPAVEWRQAGGFGLYGPGPILPERPRARLACPLAAADRLARMIASWSIRPAGATAPIPSAAAGPARPRSRG